MALLTAEKRAANGAAWLDEHEPGWHRKVKITALDMENGGRCVLGQLYGDYDQAVFFDLADELGSERKACRLGFDLPASAYTFRTDRQAYLALTDAWKDQIRARRSR